MGKTPEEKGGMTYPTVLYPTILEGYVKGDKLRVETLDNTPEMFLTGEMMQYFKGVTYNSLEGYFKLSNAGPFEYKGRTWAVSHQQKYSTAGYLKASPDCYHRWYFWKLQDKDSNGRWLPGTEKGIYLRKSAENLFGFKCWRWDVAGTGGQHWIWSNGYLGGHWD